MTDIEVLDIPERLCTILKEYGLGSVEDLSCRCGREILCLPKIGPKTLESIEGALEKQGFALANDPYAPYTCARHGQPRGDTSLASLYLCNACSHAFQYDAFRGRPPEYVSPRVSGYCLHCNRQFDDIRMHQWYLCAICERVVKSIGRSVAADEYITNWWQGEIQPHLPHLHLELIDDPELRPYELNGADNKESQVDFICRDRNSGEQIFGIELKAGRNRVGGGSIGSVMGQFQLDHSDCDAIMNVVNREDLPVYLAHVQVIDRAAPPTTYYVAVDLWWTDLFTMSANYKESKNRPRENRPAAYFDIAMFHGTQAFIDHLLDNGPGQIKARMECEGYPDLYT